MDADEMLAEMHMTPQRSGRPVHYVTAPDGTRLAYERLGFGPPMVLVGGALNDRVMFNLLAEVLAEDFTVFNYDRRGRGDSDAGPAPYSIQQEVDDLRAVMQVAGEEPYVFANCVGGVIAIHAAAQAAPMRHLLMYEPPLSPDSGGVTRHTVPEDYLERLIDLVENGTPGDVVRMFWREGADLPDEVIEQMVQHPAWPWLESLSGSLVNDTILGINGDIPHDALGMIATPTLMLNGDRSPDWQRETVRIIHRGIGGSEHVEIGDEGHVFDDVKVGQLMVDYIKQAHPGDFDRPEQPS